MKYDHLMRGLTDPYVESLIEDGNYNGGFFCSTQGQVVVDFNYQTPTDGGTSGLIVNRYSPIEPFVDNDDGVNGIYFRKTYENIVFTPQQSAYPVTREGYQYNGYYVDIPEAMFCGNICFEFTYGLGPLPHAELNSNHDIVPHTGNVFLPLIDICKVEDIPLGEKFIGSPVSPSYTSHVLINRFTYQDLNLNISEPQIIHHAFYRKSGRLFLATNGKVRELGIGEAVSLYGFFLLSRNYSQRIINSNKLYRIFFGGRKYSGDDGPSDLSNSYPSYHDIDPSSTIDEQGNTIPNSYWVKHDLIPDSGAIKLQKFKISTGNSFNYFDQDFTIGT